MTIHEIAAGLHAVPRGKSFWGYCPVHEMDGRKHNPSLQISEKNQKILIRCWAGCDQGAVIASLRELGLWPRRERLPYRTWIHVRQLENFIAEIDHEKERMINSDTCLAMILDEYHEWTDADWQIWIDLCRAQKAARKELKKLGSGSI